MKLLTKSDKVETIGRPRAGAWIETLNLHRGRKDSVVAPVRGRGLKHGIHYLPFRILGSPPCGGVD